MKKAALLHTLQAVSVAVALQYPQPGLQYSCFKLVASVFMVLSAGKIYKAPACCYFVGDVLFSLEKGPFKPVAGFSFAAGHLLVVLNNNPQKRHLLLSCLVSAVLTLSLVRCGMNRAADVIYMAIYLLVSALMAVSQYSANLGTYKVAGALVLLSDALVLWGDGCGSKSLLRALALPLYFVGTGLLFWK